MPKIKFFIFSDEAGTWHGDSEVYVRSWIAITEDDYSKLVNKIGEINGSLGSGELKWKTIAGNSKFFKEFRDISFRVYITVSSPCDIDWDNKYKILKNFTTNINLFEFGTIGEDLSSIIKKKIHDDIKNVLFLNYYERFHIQNATKRIEQIIKPTDYELIYRIDPPQMSIDGWRDVLAKISNKKSEFPKSEKDYGIQFADIVAGCFRSLFIKDHRYNEAQLFFLEIKDKLIKKNSELPNPNIIFFKEANQSLRNNVANIWKIK